MTITVNTMKLVVRDLSVTEPFYRAMGFQVVSRNTGGEKEVRQTQCWLSTTGDRTSFVLILSQFLEVSAPAKIAYPGEVWLVFMTSDVDETLRAVKEHGGRVDRAAEDRPEHDVRAAVVSDPEGHIIEVVGPMSGAAR